MIQAGPAPPTEADRPAAPVVVLEDPVEEDPAAVVEEDELLLLSPAENLSWETVPPVGEVTGGGWKGREERESEGESTTEDRNR